MIELVMPCLRFTLINFKRNLGSLMIDSIYNKIYAQENIYLGIYAKLNFPYAFVLSRKN